MKITIKNYKKYIKRLNLPLIEDDLDLPDGDNGHLLNKFYDWQEEYPTVDWSDFRDNWWKCDRCGAYDNQQCICYAR